MNNKLIDSFGRNISYLRLSVTDRCDFRCNYCMSEDMEFLPKKEILSLDEIYKVCETFANMGVRKIRVSGGEPLVRKNIMWLFEQLGKLKEKGKLDEITITTNGSQLEKYASGLKDAGVNRINVSLDTLDKDKFDTITRTTDKFNQVLSGLKKAKEVGLKVKINTVAINNFNDDSYNEFISYAIDNGFDITFIEVMPMGDIGNENRLNQFIPLTEVKNRIAERYELIPSTETTGGPSRYFRIPNIMNSKIGFISPLSNTFCSSCNRVRLTCTGVLYTCLGQDDNVDLRPILRNSYDDKVLVAEILNAIANKPKEHNFVIEKDNEVSVNRHMNVTGG
ncbi:MAG: GTP 3',8-cyclase MoaA [Alphaproteobacteria bacterium]